MAVFLSEIRHRPDFPAPGGDRDGFPFDLPAARALDGLAFEAPVIFLVGENGCGKSTVIEATATRPWRTPMRWPALCAACAGAHPAG